MFKTTAFDKLIEKATSKLLLDPDWETTLQICDSVRQGDVQPSYVIQGIRKKIENENPHVSLFALQVLESVVKNCGSYIHNEIATRDFMDFMRDQSKTRQDPVKAKVVELIQIWSYAFRNESQYKVVQDTFNVMKAEGVAFPVLKEADAMFTSEKAPEWRDGECCHRCRVQFSTFQRKHHCRACGQVFCQKCSSKSSIIPKFGIEREVRVCDLCHDTINKSGTEKKAEDDLPAEYLASSLSKQSQLPPTRSAQEIQEEEELQLALALSQSEAEAAKNKPRTRATASSYGSSGQSNSDNNVIYSQPNKIVSAPPTMIDTSDMDPELARYLNRNYWQQKSIEIKSTAPGGTVSTVQPSAPLGVTESAPKNTFNHKEEEKYQNGDVGGNTEAREQFLRALHSSVEIFVNRMKSNSQRGRSIANDSSVQTLFMTLNAMHPQLVSYIQEQEEQRAHYESLQDKLTQLKDARDALDVLREEHREKKRREQEEMERLRQVQMMQKLEILRQKKQEYLEYQRQMALQRMQDQEMEMRRRLEQQKQDQHMRAMQYTHPQVYGQPAGPQATYMANAVAPDGSPLHQMHGGGLPQGQYTNYPMSTVGPMTSGMIQMQPGGPMVSVHGPPGQPPVYSQMGYMGPTVHAMNYASGPPQQIPPNVYPTATTATVDAQHYNMQGVPSSLQGQQQGGHMPGGEYLASGPPGGMQVHYASPQNMQQQMHGQLPGPQPGQVPVQLANHQPGPNESALINFD